MPTRNFPPVDLLPMPEDFKKDVTCNPTDDDGLPAELDGPISFSSVGPCSVVSPPTDGDHAGDAAWATCVPDGAAKNGDTVGVTATFTSEGVTCTQTANTALTAGGAVGAAFSESGSRPINPPPA